MKHVLDVVEEVSFKEALVFSLILRKAALAAKVLFYEGYDSDFLQEITNYLKIMESNNASLEEAKAKRDGIEAEEFGYNYNGYR